MSEPDRRYDMVAESLDFHLEPRCRVCRNDDVRKTVNDLLASGCSYAMVLRALGEGDAALAQSDRVTIDSIRNHSTRHFPVQRVARATYREILERRAQENGVDFANGVIIAVTPLAVLETVMVKGYQTLVEEGTTVSYRDGMDAALKLADELRKGDGDHDKAHMLAEMSRIIDAVQEFVPRERWPQLQAKLGGDSVPPLSSTGVRVRQTSPVRIVAITDRDDEE